MALEIPSPLCTFDSETSLEQIKGLFQERDKFKLAAKESPENVTAPWL